VCAGRHDSLTLAGRIRLVLAAGMALSIPVGAAGVAFGNVSSDARATLAGIVAIAAATTVHSLVTGRASEKGDQ